MSVKRCFDDYNNINLVKGRAIAGKYIHMKEVKANEVWQNLKIKTGRDNYVTENYEICYWPY